MFHLRGRPALSIFNMADFSQGNVFSTKDDPDPRDQMPHNANRPKTTWADLFSKWLSKICAKYFKYVP